MVNRMTKNLVMAGMVMMIGFSGIAMGAVLYNTSFESSEGYSVASLGGQPATNPPVWGTWNYSGAVKTSNPFTGTQCARISWSSKDRITFNTDSNAGNQKVWVESYLRPGDQSGTGHQEIGLMAADDYNQAAVVYSETGASGGTLGFRTTTGTTTSDDGTFAFGNYYHVVMEVDFSTELAKVYAKQVTAGDTSPLATTDILHFGGSETISFDPHGTAYARRLYMSSYDGMDSRVDDLKVSTDNLIVPEPATIGFLCLGVVGLLRRSK